MCRVRFWLRLFFYPLFVIVVVSILAICWLASSLRSVVSWLAERSLPGYALEIADAEFCGPWRIEFGEVRLTSHRETKAVLSLAGGAIDYSVGGLWRKRIGGIELEQPQVKVDDAVIRAFLPAASSAPNDRTTWQVNRFVISKGEAEIDLPQFPRAQFKFEASLADLRSAPGPESGARQQIALKSIRLTERDANSSALVTAESATISFTLEQLARNRVQELILSAPSIHLQPSLLAAFPGAAGAQPTPGSNWQLQRLKISDGEIFLEGFGSQVPIMSAKFALDTTDLSPGSASEATHAAQVWDVRAAAPRDPSHPFLQLESATIDFSTAGLARREITKVETTGLWLSLNASLRSLIAAPASTPAASSAEPWRIADLTIENGYVSVSNLGLDLPDLGFYVRTELKDVAASGEPQFASDQLQTVELSNITIPSPLDPFVPVLNLKTIFVRFSLAQLLRNQIEEITILNPQIFVGEDLFWYADLLGRRQPTDEASRAPAPRWLVRQVSADLGEMVIANGGSTRATLPLTFSWRASDLDFSNLGDLQLKLNLVIPEADYRFPSYELTLDGLSGKIEFGLPPAARADNLVHTINVKGVRWKQFATQKAFVSVTYDREGIYGEVGGRAYGGYVNGGFSFFSAADSPWSGWVSGSGINLRGVTDVLAPQNFQMSGPADFKLEVSGVNHLVERLRGTYSIRAAGKLKVGKLDDLLAELPAEWTVLKRSLTRIGLETLRDFDYQSGNGSFWFASDKGDLKLALFGPTGSRKVEVVLHGKDSPLTLP